MFGVGRNPVYMARLEERQRKKEASGEAEAERVDAEIARKVGALFDECPVDEPEYVDIQWTVPRGVASGDEVCVPHDGAEFCMIVPDGFSAGDTITVSVPCQTGSDSPPEPPATADGAADDLPLEEATSGALDALFGGGYVEPDFDL